jgi:GNAT superfamily N-acetyltransferase
LRAQASQQPQARRHSCASIDVVSDAPLRAATDDDVAAIAAVWREAWHDAHHGHVPASIVTDRPPEYFARRAAELIGSATVAEDDAGVVGFVNVDSDELDLLFVARRGRGTGVAAALLRCGEQQIATSFETAWLEVVAGNARARRFYARMGWVDAGPLESLVQTSSGPATVVSRRYERAVRT